MRATLAPTGRTRWSTALAGRTPPIVAAIAALAFAVRLLPVLRGGGLNGIIDYDDAVYFGSAVAWLHGFIPYRDFLLLHPPGILYALSPFAALGAALGDATGFALARLAFMLLGVVNTVLVALVAGRLGRRAAICAAALYAGWAVGVLTRLRTIEGLPGSGPGLRAIPDALVVLAFIVTVAAVAVVARQRPAIRLWALLAGVQVGALLVLPNFFGHYKGWIAPAAALTIGVSAATLIGRLGQDGWRPIAARIAYGLALATLAAAAVIYRQGTRLPTV